jgi:molybdate transport system ATP-binding protein
VFQEASLFEHLNVRQNLLFGVRRTSKAGNPHSLDAELELLGIGRLLDRAVTSLFGGERQRVAIARALAAQPKLLLLDEPLASLNVARRKAVLPWLERLHDDCLLRV